MKSAIAIFSIAFIHGAIVILWDIYKKRQAQKPTPMALRKGVYVPWGPVEKAQRVFRVLINLYLVWLVILLSAVAYSYFIGPVFS